MIGEGKFRVVRIPGDLPSFEFPLDAGEAEAIALAVQEEAALILADDLEAREEAERLGLKIRGTVGIVLDAFERKSCPREKPKNCSAKHASAAIFG